VKTLYDRRAWLYDIFIGLVGHRRAMQRYFLKSTLLRDGMRVLDAGSGSGAVFESISSAARTRNIQNFTIDGFDISSVMLMRLKKRLAKQTARYKLGRADVLQLDRDLDKSWSRYNVIVSSGMLEYVPREKLPVALANIKKRLMPQGTLVVFISKDTARNRLVIGKFWRANLYNKEELESVFATAGLRVRSVMPFARWGYVVQAN
jgi:cyclopropane fatty-acyl-phospholipid synthase-like methyltransferase